MPIIDFQTQLFSERLAQALPPVARKWGKFWSKPASRALHRVQPFVRFLHPIGKGIVGEIGALAPLSHLLFESSLEDLTDSMEQSHIDRSVVMGEFAGDDPRFISTLRIGRLPATEEKNLATKFEAAHAAGTRILQIHPAADGLDPSTNAYQAQVSAASERGWIIVLQTGTPQSHIVYRRPGFADITRFRKTFSEHPNTPFVIARMNFDRPDLALDFADLFPNLYLETSWQPTETIGEAVRRVGSERLLFGSDWPILGNNQKVCIRRIRDAAESQLITSSDSERILGLNAEALLRKVGESR
ncbi:MAG: amidohydrolase family protein [Cryobacterium sp.]|nr:amidohydrolase family protein [Oligoflexia bacterium]